MVELLPHLGNGDLAGLHVDPGKSWAEDPNDQVARVVVPQFLAQGKTGFEYRYIRYPTLAKTFAPTHFVGMAGVGLDAAAYAADDPATAAKRGIFGYDRVTRPEDVKDGLAKTILLIQVPADHKSPWMAGGGSTVRGVSEEDDCVGPFVCAEYRGKKGTFAVMADGKVRFIPAAIDPKVFRALCTIAGGEPITNLDGIAPEVPNEDASELQTAPVVPAAGPETPVAGGKLPAGWKEHVSKEGRFAVALPPGTPRQVTETQKVPEIGEVTAHAMVLEQERGGDKPTFMVMCAELPPAAVKQGIDALLERQGQGKLLEKVPNAKVSKISLDGNPGREVSFSIPGGGSVKFRAFLVKNRMYSLHVAGGKAMDPKEQQAFFDSFRLLK
jgi:hypothetical protein